MIDAGALSGCGYAEYIIIMVIRLKIRSNWYVCHCLNYYVVAAVAARRAFLILPLLTTYSSSTWDVL